jgi:hypothetical protein
MSTCWMCSGFENKTEIRIVKICCALILGCYCDDGFMVNDEDGECILEDTLEHTSEVVFEDSIITGETFDSELENELENENIFE